MKKVYINESFMMGIDLAEAYCAKKSKLFNRFFGWREATKYRMGYKIADCHLYLLPKAVANMLETLVVDKTEVTVV